MTKRKVKRRPFYQYEYDRLMGVFREKRRLLRRLLDHMDADETGHDWPGIWWLDTIHEVQSLALQLAVMRQAAKDRDEPMLGVPRESDSP